MGNYEIKVCCCLELELNQKLHRDSCPRLYVDLSELSRLQFISSQRLIQLRTDLAEEECIPGGPWWSGPCCCSWALRHKESELLANEACNEALEMCSSDSAALSTYRLTDGDCQSAGKVEFSELQRNVVVTSVDFTFGLGKCGSV